MSAAPQSSQPDHDALRHSAQLAEKLSRIVLQMETTGDWRLSEPEAQTITDSAKLLLALAAPPAAQTDGVSDILRSTEMQAVGQEAIRKHPYYEGAASAAYGFSGAVLSAVADALEARALSLSRPQENTP